jgi:beta-N-acetylhexosaminidase
MNKVDIENPVDQIVDRTAEILLGAQGRDIQNAAARFAVG